MMSGKYKNKSSSVAHKGGQNSSKNSTNTVQPIKEVEKPTKQVGSFINDNLSIYNYLYQSNKL